VTETRKEQPASVPRIEVEEDEDVEPTRVGRAQQRAPIRPLVEKIVFDEGADEPADPASAASLLIHAVAQTDTGRRRKQNEDSYLLLDKESVFIVADGMGGHRGGQVASKLAVTTMGHAFERKNFEAAAHENIALEASELARAVQMANTAIFTEAKKSRDLEGMGTTLVAARFSADKQRLYIAHVGDSRCYRVRDGVMRQMTSDHTMADYGVTGPEGAHLSRALGVWPTVPIDVIMVSPEVGDLYLLCSDGLTKMISDGTIATQLLHEEDPKAAVSRLVFFANSHGGKDNITVVLLRVVPPGWKPPRTTLPPPSASEA
jgi:protein phosphatase